MAFGFKRKSDREPEWVASLRSGLGGRNDEIVEYIRTGTRKPAPPVELRNPAAGSRMSPAQAARFAEVRQSTQWRDVVTKSGLDWLTLTESMPFEPRDRFGRLLNPTDNATAAATPNRWLQRALGRTCPPNATMYQVEAAGAWLGYSLDDMVRYVFCQMTTPPAAKELESWTSARLEQVRTVVAPELAKDTRLWSRILRGGRDLLNAFHRELVTTSTSSAKTVRAAAGPALAAIEFATIEPDLKRVAKEGQPASRAIAVRLLVELAPAEHRDELAAWVAEQCAGDRAKAVQDAIAALSGSAEPQPSMVELPTVDFDQPVAADTRRRLSAALSQKLQGRPIAAGAGDRLVEVMEGRQPTRRGTNTWSLIAARDADPGVGTDLSPLHVARVLLSDASHHTRFDRSEGSLITAGRPTPLELAVVAGHAGVEDVADRVIVGILGSETPDVWPTNDVAAWVLHRFPRLEQYLTTQTDQWMFSRPGLHRALASATDRPEALTRALVQSGVTGFKTDRAEVRRLLGRDVTDRVVAYLKSGKTDERAGAANWLRELKDPAAEAPLRAAIEREKVDVAKAQMLAAIEAAGGSLDEYLAPDRLLADAEAALAKPNAVPAALDWLSFESLPAVHWRDGSLIAPSVFRWFTASAVKAKVVEPSPLLRRYADAMEPQEATRFAEALFERWVSKDLEPAPVETCEERARTIAAAMVQAAKRNPTFDTYVKYRGLTVEQAMQFHLPVLLATPVGSANDSKGLLSVVAAMGGPELAGRALAYIKKWRGHRLHQGKAMIQMLAWMEFPAAIQVVLSISQRFRPKGLQQEAEAQAASLAERRGWTVDDLADRTVPRGGFDDDGRQVIDYGSRTFTAHLRDDLTIELVADETGKTIKALPDARQTEDDAEVKALQKDLAAAKKEIKATATLQPERLFVAMCVGRTWDSDDFRRYILAHPVMRRLACRLVWIADSEGAPRLFRPLSDATMIDIDDRDVPLPDNSRVRLAHDALVDAAVAAAWTRHLADYKIAPLFAQFGRPMLPDGTVGPAIDEFKGHMINALSLRGIVTKRGWQLGQAMDAGMIHWAQHDFPAGGLSAVLEFHGIPAFAEDSETALLSLYFVKTGSAGDRNRARRLADVPPILLREAYADAEAIAATGTGFDPDYEKRSAYA